MASRVLDFEHVDGSNASLKSLVHVVTAVGKALHLDDCILYLWSGSRQKLVQRAAHGPKVNVDGQILNPLELSLGQGVVGTVAQSRVAEVIPDVSKDSRYVLDIEGRRSEITVPVVYGDSLIGVIDAESVTLDAFSEDDLSVLSTLADLCASALVNLRHIDQEHKRAHRMFESSDARYRNVVELSPNMIYTTTPDGVIEYVNPACEELLGVKASAMVGKLITEFVPESIRSTFARRLDALCAGSDKRIVIEVPMTTTTQSEVATEQTISATWADSRGQERVIGLQSIVRDITGQQALQKSLVYLANHDPLTELLSRRGFESAFDAQWQRLRLTRGDCAVFWIDVDEFKALNDTHGHYIGDKVLKNVASVFKEHTHHEDVVARIGGDEFVVLLRGASVEAAEVIAQRVTQSVHSNVAPALGLPKPVSISIGIATKRPSDHYPQDLMARADEALYAAKRAGRNRYHVHRNQLGWLESRMVD